MANLSPKEILEEVEWLTMGGMSAAYICDVLDVKAESIARMAERRNMSKISELFREEMAQQKRKDYGNREKI
jgi:hypothetical protein